MKRMNPLRQAVAILVLLSLVFQWGCNAANIQAYVNLAAQIALQVAVLAGAPPAVAARVAGDLAKAQKLIADYQAASAAGKPGLAAEVDAALNVAQADLNDIFVAARIGDPKLQAVIRAALAIGITAIESIRALALKNAPPLVKVTLRAKGIVVPKGQVLTPAQLKAQYNQAVAAYPEAQLK